MSIKHLPYVFGKAKPVATYSETSTKIFINKYVSQVEKELFSFLIPKLCICMYLYILLI